MSKLATVLRRLARAEPAPMGFAAPSSRTKNREILLAVGMEKPDLDAAKAAAKDGADLILFAGGDLDKGAAKIKAIAAAVELPCGLSVAKPTSSTVASAHAAGLDFLRIEDDGAPASILLDEEMGYVFSVVGEPSDTSLRMLESTPFDALYVGALTQPFSIRQQLELRRISALARKPLLLQFTDALSSEEFECLRDSGVGALLLEGPDAASRLGAARTAIDAMRPRRRRRSDRDTTPTLPSVGRSDGDEDEDD
jgi:hypothetical protein